MFNAKTVFVPERKLFELILNFFFEDDLLFPIVEIINYASFIARHFWKIVLSLELPVKDCYALASFCLICNFIIRI